tara:strand:+ start:2541 stop:3710 length:1170 start_codon:yes stop_codon:yes gene_type:complete
MKLWEKNGKLKKEVESYTVGNDYVLDQQLVGYDCKASMAHAKMLHSIKILSKDELEQLLSGLKEIQSLATQGKFLISKEEEDCHTAIENYLTKKLGEVGKKIHTGRSRNDQVKVALHLYFKDKLSEIKNFTTTFSTSLDSSIKKYGKIKLPGYTHMQKAMPSSIELWLGSFAASAKDNLKLIDTALSLVDQNPLGSGAGFGIPVIDVDSELTAKELGFSKVQENSLYVQLSRGKFEGILMSVCDAILYDLNKLASDLLLFSMSEFNFVSLPDDFLTGSSIMPQKKNYDVLELVRAKYHLVLGYEFQVKSLIGDLISGYNRDMQLTKEPIMKSLEITKETLQIMDLVVKNLIVKEENCSKAMTDDLYATEKAYKLVSEGMSFRDAYKELK